MSDHVWVIEAGDYSDYRVVGVFSSRENAAMVMARMREGYSTPTISKWPLDPMVAELAQGLTLHRVVMAIDGTLERCDEREIPSYDGMGADGFFVSRVGDGGEVAAATVWARDKEHAVKIVNERRLQWIAKGEKP